MSRDRDVKKSNFNTVLSAVSTDKFDFIRGNQNLAITLENLITSMGVSGALMSVGEPTAIPVLSQNAGINYIRSILAGPGVAVDVSPQNGVQISQNFTVDKTGVPVMINEGSSSPTFRSIEAGSGISVAADGDKIQVSASAVPVSTKTVNVYELDDLPTPVAGIITLSDDTEYRLLNDISSINRYVMGENTILSGADGNLITLEYTGSGTMITASDVNFFIKDITLYCDLGTLFDVSSSDHTHKMSATNGAAHCNNIGNFDNLISLYMMSFRFNANVNGFTFENDFDIVLLDGVGITILSGSGNGFTLGTATFDFFTMDKLLAGIYTSGYVLSGLANSGNINAGGLGVVVNSKNFGTATNSDNITPYDDRWEAQLNSKLINSYDLCLATHSGGTITIASAATPVKIGNTWTGQDLHRFTATAAGTFTYNGKGTHVGITATISATIALATDEVVFYIYKNGVQVTASAVTRAFSAGTIGNIVLVYDLELETSDYLELYVANNDTDVDVIIDTIIFRARS